MAAAEAATHPPVATFPASGQAIVDDDGQGIGRRTRARHPLDNISMTDLAAMLTVEEESEVMLMSAEEEEQYHEFLQVGWCCLCRDPSLAHISWLCSVSAASLPASFFRLLIALHAHRHLLSFTACIFWNMLLAMPVVLKLGWSGAARRASSGVARGRHG